MNLLTESWFIILLLVLATEFLLGFFVIRQNISKWISWIFPIGAVSIMMVFMPSDSYVFRMAAFIVVLLVGMKVVMARHYPQLTFTWGKWFLYCFTWVGMNPEIFFKKRLTADRSLLIHGLINFFTGVTILVLLRIGLVSGFIPIGINHYAVSLVLLISLSLVLHFGILNITAWVLQCFGYPAYSLFREPLKSNSLRDFWGKRWNLAFTEMTSVLIFRPLSQRISVAVALTVSFIFSGLLHEVALSLPIRNGYGLPTLYFVIQFLLIQAEERIFKKKPGKLWVILSLVLPLPILFHGDNLLVFWQLVAIRFCNSG